jgi:hypothetical protein
MAKNQLAKDIRAGWNRAFNAGLQSALDIMTVALNNRFGFGRDRLLALEEEFKKLYMEYGHMCIDSPNYGSSKLKKRIDQIMREVR